jgi:hypothetical protein
MGLEMSVCRELDEHVDRGASRLWRRLGLLLRLCFLSAMVLGGCQRLSVWDIEPQGSGDGGLRATVSYAAAVQGMRARELERQYYRLTRVGLSAHPIRAALLLSQPDAPFRDLTRARHFLDVYLKHNDSKGACCRDFAVFLHAATMQQAALREEAEKTRSTLETKLAAAVQKRDALQSELERLRAALDQERSKRQKLESQIDALKTIEKNLNKVE